MRWCTRRAVPPPLAMLYANESENETDISHDMTPRPATPPLSSKKGNPVCTSPTVINDFGFCSACGDENALDKCVSCLLCNKSFHAICRLENGGSDNILCNQTFLGQFSKRLDKKDSFSGSFCFICDPCLTDHEHKQAVSLQAHVHTLERKIEFMGSNLAQIKDLIVNQGARIPVPAPVPPHTVNASLPESNIWNNNEGLKRVKSKTPIIVKMNSAGTTVADSDLEKIITENKIQVDKSYRNKIGENVLVVEKSEDREKLTSKLRELHPDHKVFQPPERLPTISVANIIDNISPDQLKERILSMHDEISSLVNSGSTFEVLYIREQRSGKRYQACIRVSNEIRKFIDHLGNRVYIGMYSCNVYDHFFIKRCNNCQKFHHYQDKCRASKPACAKCAGEHKTIDCTFCNETNFVPTCINCKNEKTSFIHTHEASSLECPSYQAAQDKLKKSIKFYNSKNMS